MTTPASVLIADPHPTTRASLRRVLESAGYRTAAEAADAGEALAAAAANPDACLLDVDLPGGGIRAAREIAAATPRAAVIMLAAQADTDQLFDAVRAGARGYLLKSMNPDRLPDAVRGVLDGEAAIPRHLVASLVRELHSRGRRRAVVGRHGQIDLSPREWEVLDLFTRELGTEEIAERLFVSPVTVRRHLSSVVSKLGAADRQEALLMLANMPTRSADR